MFWGHTFKLQAKVKNNQDLFIHFRSYLYLCKQNRYNIRYSHNKIYMKTKLTFIPSYVLRLFAVVSFLQTISTAVMADDPVTLNIHLSNGTIQSILLYTRPQVTFEGGRVVFTSPVATFS